MSEEEKGTTLHEIKKQKQTTKSKAAKLVNIQKAIAAKKKKYEERKNLNKIESTIDDIIKSDSDSKSWSEESIKEIKKNKKSKVVPHDEINQWGYTPDLKALMEQMCNINKKVDRLYTMKKNKQPKIIPVVENKKQSNKDEAMDVLRWKFMGL